jgi:hypothetical protein
MCSIITPDKLNQKSICADKDILTVPVSPTTCDDELPGYIL